MLSWRNKETREAVAISMYEKTQLRSDARRPHTITDQVTLICMHASRADNMFVGTLVIEKHVMIGNHLPGNISQQNFRLNSNSHSLQCMG